MRIAILAAMLAVMLAAPGVEAQQVVDPDFDPKVAAPAYPADGPRVVIDEAHHNFHTASGRYAPFAALLRADGYSVEPGTLPFDGASLAEADVLVVANATAPEGETSPFAEGEIAALEQWVREGGSLLLISDHAPFGTAAESLAARFGVALGKGWVFEPRKPGRRRESEDEGEGGVLKWQIDFARADGRLGDGPIAQGRSPEEAVSLVRSFTGQSLIGPPGAVVLMRLPGDAREAPDQALLDAAIAAARKSRKAPVFPEAVASVAGKAQGIAFAHGEGRVVVLGEAAMLTAQLREFRPELKRPPKPFGMNVPGIDNRQFALNLLHWLSRALEQTPATPAAISAGSER